MSIPDPVAELVSVLLADPDVAALVADNVFGGGLTAEARNAMPTPAVVLAQAGGPGRRGFVKYRRQRITAICYGETLKESWDVHAAVREVLEGLRRTGSVFWAETISEGTNAIDPRTQWPTCLASYMVMSATSADT